MMEKYASYDSLMRDKLAFAKSKLKGQQVKIMKERAAMKEAVKIATRKKGKDKSG